MPDMILGRTRTLASVLGHVVNFKKDVPVHVAPAVVPEAIALGAAYVGGEAAVLGVDDDEVAADRAERDAYVNDPVKRKAAIIKAFKVLTSRNERGSFDAAGRPHPKAVSSMVEFKVDAKERDVVWQEHIDAMANPDGSD